MDPYQALQAEISFVEGGMHDWCRTLGQFLEYTLENLYNDFNEACYEGSTCAMKAETRYRKFEQCANNIFHTAATVLQNRLKTALDRKYPAVSTAHLRQRNHPACFVRMDIDHTPEFDDKSREELIEEIMRLRAELQERDIINPETEYYSQMEV